MVVRAPAPAPEIPGSANVGWRERARSQQSLAVPILSGEDAPRAKTLALPASSGENAPASLTDVGSRTPRRTCPC